MGRELSWNQIELTETQRTSQQPIVIARSTLYVLRDNDGEMHLGNYEIHRMGGGDGFIADGVSEGRGIFCLGEFASEHSAKLACAAHLWGEQQARAGFSPPFLLPACAPW